MSIQAIAKLARDGVVVRLTRGQYDLDKSRTNYIRHLRDAAAGRGGKDSVETLSEERARLASEQADHHALKNAQLRSELVRVVDVESTWSSILGEVRAGLLSVPSRIQQRIPTLTSTDVSVIDTEVREVLRGLADDGSAS